jgi:hypothetical protein
MPRPVKYDEVPFEQVNYSGKIFIYNSPEWNILYPVVNIIRLLEPNTIISHKYGKGQMIIKTYSTQYFHRVLGVDLKTTKDYIKNIVTGMVKIIFIFTDSSDLVATNLLDLANKYRINTVCYSMIDSVYHFYDYSDPDKVAKSEFKSAEEVIGLMNNLSELNKLNKLSELFPDFEIIEHPKDKELSTLETCVNIIKNSTLIENNKKDSMKIKVYDSNLSRIKKMSYDRSQRNLKFDDDLDIITKTVKKLDLQTVDPIRKNLLSKFFNKNIIYI